MPENYEYRLVVVRVYDDREYVGRNRYYQKLGPLLKFIAKDTGRYSPEDRTRYQVTRRVVGDWVDYAA